MVGGVVSAGGCGKLYVAIAEHYVKWESSAEGKEAELLTINES